MLGLNKKLNSTARARLNQLCAPLGSERGNMLVMFLVAATVIGTLASVSGDVIKNQLSRVETNRMRQLTMSNFERLRLLIAGLESCTTLFTTAPITYSVGTPMPIATLDVGGASIAVGAQGNLNISSMNLIHEVALPQVFDAAGNLRDHNRARLDITGQISTGARVTQFTKSFALDVVLSAGGVINNCYRGQDTRVVACQVMNGTYNPVTGVCAMPPQGPVTGACPAGECIYGFNDQNERLCRPM